MTWITIRVPEAILCCGRMVAAVPTDHQAAEGTDLTVQVEKVTKPTEVQKQAAGDNGYIVGVTVTSQLRRREYC